MRLLSSGIPAHAYGEAYESWTDLVVDQHWDVTVPVISEDDEETNTQQALERHFDPAEFLVAAARQGRPLGIALNGVPFFSPLSETGAIGCGSKDNDNVKAEGWQGQGQLDVPWVGRGRPMYF